jgi:hypothetical protein
LQARVADDFRTDCRGKTGRIGAKGKYFAALQQNSWCFSKTDVRYVHAALQHFQDMILSLAKVGSYFEIYPKLFGAFHGQP